jgi:hypothetical protein
MHVIILLFFNGAMSDIPISYRRPNARYPDQLPTKLYHGINALHGGFNKVMAISSFGLNMPA